jgi:hypothetical protein|tara:strand:- start:814 stop:1377 length:564 start_codon:yes stop_codon:yes gene_type:complete
MSKYSTQNSLLLENLLDFYSRSNNLERILPIINGKSKISLRLIDWFATNYCKKHYVVYNIVDGDKHQRFKVYQDYKLKLKAYSKRRFDPFCRWERITIPYENNTCIETTIGQLNFFRWYIENKILDYIEENFERIENDMNNRNSISKKRVQKHILKSNKTRKKRQELSVSAIKSIKKEKVEIVVKFE